MKLIIIASIAFAILAPIASSRKAVFFGGNEDDNNTAVYTAFAKLATPQDQAPYIGIITAASDPEDAESDGEFYVQLFTLNYSLSNVEWLPIDLNNITNADDPTLVAKLENMTGVFFGGGDQERLITVFYRDGRNETATIAAIRERYESGDLVIAGTSAGTTIMQATPMVSGGESWDGLAYGTFNASDAEDSDAVTYDAGGGFGFFTYGFLDTHFCTRGREGRMMSLLHDLKSNGTRGVGIDENTALVMTDDVFEVVGYNGAYIIDATNSFSDEEGEGAFLLTNMKISYLTTGDTFNMTDGSVVFANWKANIRGREQNSYPMNPTLDIFSSLNDPDQNGDRKYPEMFTNVTTNLFNSALSNTTHGFTWETNPGFRLDFVKGDDSSGAIGVFGQNTYISYVNMTASVRCVSNCGKSFLDAQNRRSKKTAEDRHIDDLRKVVGNMELPAFLFGGLFETNDK